MAIIMLGAALIPPSTISGTARLALLAAVLLLVEAVAWACARIVERPAAYSAAMFALLHRLGRQPAARSSA